MNIIWLALLSVPFLNNANFSNDINKAASQPILKVYDDTKLSTQVSFVCDENDTLNLEYDPKSEFFVLYELPEFIKPFKIVTNCYESPYFSNDLFNSDIRIAQTRLTFRITLNENNQITFNFISENNEDYKYTSNDCCINVETNVGNSLIKLKLEESQTSFFSFEKNDIGTNSSRTVNTFFVPKQQIVDGNHLTILLFDPYTLNKKAESNTLTIKEGDASFLFNVVYKDSSLILEKRSTAFVNKEKLASYAVSDIISKYFTYEADKNNGYLMWPYVVQTWIKNDKDYFLDLPLESIKLNDFNNLDDYKTGQNKTFKTSLKNKCEKMQTLYDIYQKQHQKESVPLTIVFYFILIISLLGIITLLSFAFFRRILRKKH